MMRIECATCCSSKGLWKLVCVCDGLGAAGEAENGINWWLLTLWFSFGTWPETRYGDHLWALSVSLIAIVHHA